jgi:hypothetical protein
MQYDRIRGNVGAMDNTETKTLILNRQQLRSFCQALTMTAEMIEGSFDEETEPASPETLRAVAARGTTPAFDERVVTFPGVRPREATLLPANRDVRALVLKQDEVDDVAHALQSFMDAEA